MLCVLYDTILYYIERGRVHLQTAQHHRLRDFVSALGEVHVARDCCSELRVRHLSMFLLHGSLQAVDQEHPLQRCPTHSRVVRHQVLAKRLRLEEAHMRGARAKVLRHSDEIGPKRHT